MWSRCVAAEDREAWLREWRAELEHAWRAGSGEDGGRARSSMIRRVLFSSAEDALRTIPGRIVPGARMQDVGFAVRSLRRNPGYALAAVITLGLGTGANTAIFSVVNAYLLAPYPFPQPERVVALVKAQGERMNATSAPNFIDWRTGGGAFMEMAAAHVWSANLTDIAVPLRVSRTRVTGGFFDVLGVSPLFGRTFDDASITDDAAVAVLSHELWSSSFGADQGVLGRTVEIDGVAHTVIGVMPPAFRVPPLTAAIWVPLVFEPDALAARGRNNLYVVARLKPGVTLEAAQSSMQPLGTRLALDYPASNEGWNIRVLPLRQLAVGSSQAGLWKLLAGVMLVLLIACVNVANLVIARGMARERELAVRVSLGATRSRLLGQLLAETIVLGLAGGALGYAMAIASLGPIRSLVPAPLARTGDVALDGAVLAFTFAVSLLTGLLAGLIPALRLSRVAPGSVRRAGVAASLRTRGAASRVRTTLAAAQFALATVLLIAAGLVARSLAQIYAVDVGVRYDGITNFAVTFPEAAFPAPEHIIGAIDGITERLRATNGVAAVAAISHLPLSGARLSSSILHEGGPTQMATAGPSAAIKVVTPEYFDVLGIPLVAGRLFDQRDDARTGPVALINQSAASTWWPGQDPIGRWIAYAPGPDGEDVRMRIVGVIADVRYAGPTVPAQPEVYEAYRQTREVWRWFGRAMTFVVRTNDGRTLGIQPIRDAVAASDPDLPITGHSRLADVLHASVATPRFNGALLHSFAALALILAIVGTYGVLAFAVRQRAREVGIRMALGAPRATVIVGVLRDGFRIALAGAACGLLGALALGRVLRTFVWGIAPTDPITWIAVIAVLGGATLAAAWIPARRAAAVDPAVTLRSD